MKHHRTHAGLLGIVLLALVATVGFSIFTRRSITTHPVFPQRKPQSLQAHHTKPDALPPSLLNADSSNPDGSRAPLELSKTGITGVITNALGIPLEAAGVFLVHERPAAIRRPESVVPGDTTSSEMAFRLLDSMTIPSPRPTTPQVITDAQGRYVLWVAPGTYMIAATYQDMITATSKPVDVQVGQMANGDLSLEESFTVEGQLIDMSGPLSNKLLISYSGPMGSPQSLRYSLTPDESGYFRAALLSKGKYLITIQERTSATFPSSINDSSDNCYLPTPPQIADAGQGFVRFVLLRRPSLAGTVGSSKIYSVFAELVRPGNALVLGLGTAGSGTFRDSAFRLHLNHTGMVMIAASNEDGWTALYGPISVQSGEAITGIQLGPIQGATLKGRVLSSNGKFIEGAHLVISEMVWGEVRVGLNISTYSKALGEFSLSGLPQTTVVMRITAEGQHPLQVDTDLRKGSLNVDVHLIPKP